MAQLPARTSSADSCIAAARPLTSVLGLTSGGGAAARRAARQQGEGDVGTVRTSHQRHHDHHAGDMRAEKRAEAWGRAGSHRQRHMSGLIALMAATLRRRASSVLEKPTGYAMLSALLGYALAPPMEVAAQMVAA